MGKIPANALVMIGDGEKALFLRNEGDAAFPNLTVEREMAQENPPTHEQGTHPPGRLQDGPGPHSSAVEDTDWQRLGKERFASEIADRLYKSAHRNEYQHLIIAAPPMVLGELRKALHKEVKARLLFDIDKELTNHPVGDIEKAIAAA